MELFCRLVREYTGVLRAQWYGAALAPLHGPRLCSACEDQVQDERMAVKSGGLDHDGNRQLGTLIKAAKVNSVLVDNINRTMKPDLH